MKNLEKFGVQELTTVEQVDNQGGFFPIVVWGVVIGAEYVAGLFLAGVGIGAAVAQNNCR